MKKFLRTAMAIACLLSLFMPMQAQERAGATEEEYGKIVVHLETAKWGQDSPYNKLCFTSNGSQAITGCVPTAYAILMNYHKWPAKANEKRVYHSGTGESMTLGHVYDWDNMLSSYSGTYTDEEANTGQAIQHLEQAARVRPSLSISSNKRVSHPTPPRQLWPQTEMFLQTTIFG